MGLDRFVHFDEEIPTIEQLTFILEDYLGDIGAKIDYQENCWFVSLPGKPSAPLKRVSSYGEMVQSGLHDERWFEVFVGCLNHQSTKDEEFGPHIDVITRFQDELVNCIAEGYARRIAKWFKAKYDDGT